MASTIVLLGPPGSGKGTQAEHLRDDGWLTLSTGDLLREARSQGTELGEQASGYMDRGELVPDDLIVALIGDQLDGRDDESIVLDGFPRTVAQADALGRGAGAARARAHLGGADRRPRRGRRRAHQRPRPRRRRVPRPSASGCTSTTTRPSR